MTMAGAVLIGLCRLSAPGSNTRDTQRDPSQHTEKSSRYRTHHFELYGSFMNPNIPLNNYAHLLVQTYFCFEGKKHILVIKGNALYIIFNSCLVYDFLCIFK